MNHAQEISRVYQGVEFGMLHLRESFWEGSPMISAFDSFLLSQHLSQDCDP